MHILNNIARSYQRKGDFTNARQYYTRALDEEGDLYEKTTVYYNLGLLEYGEGNHEVARGRFIQVINASCGHKIMQDARQKLSIINALFVRGAEVNDS